MLNTIERISENGQSIWCDNISRKLIDSGELERLIELGVVGVTSNPTIFMKAITGGPDYDERIQRLIDDGKTGMALYEGLVLADVGDAADILKPVYDRTSGVDGFVSLEVNPNLANDTAATIGEARRLFAALDRPNVFIKVPGTEAGIPAIEALIAEGINVNVTLIFSGTVYEKVAQAYIAGLTRLVASGGDPSKVASVASFFVSRVDTLVDSIIEEQLAAVPDDVEEDDDASYLLGQTAIANARIAYARFAEIFDETGPFGVLIEAGARPQRPLWASTSTKNPDLPDTMYIDALIGPNTVNTLPPASIDAVLDHGNSFVMIHDELDHAREMIADLARFGIDFDAVTDKLLVDGVEIFAQSFDDLVASLGEKERKLSAVS
ncbi:MAG: transaldolase [Planctomycetes bacterium]|nr:transaldolase [Planctomycetota bacterium]